MLSHVLDNIAADASSPSDKQVVELRRMLARRPHQGVALPSIQHAFRIFAEHVYDELAAAASSEDQEELLAVIRGGKVLMRFADVVIGIVTQAYLDEMEDVRGDREIVSRSLLDSVLAGRSSSPSTKRDARILGIDLIPQNVVVVARARWARPAPAHATRRGEGAPQRGAARSSVTGARSWASARASSVPVSGADAARRAAGG